MNKEEYKNSIFGFYARQAERSGCGGPILITCLVGLLFLLFGCSPRVITVPEYHVEYKTNTVHDSIYFEKRDSIFTIVRGDTVYVQHWQVKYKDRYVYITDSVVKTDSVAVPYPVPAQLSKWQSFCCDYGKLMLGVSLSSLVILFLFIIKSIKTKS